MWILIDNYDSFTYILKDFLKQLHEDVIVFKNDEITIEQLKLLTPERIIISPGPKQPRDAGITMNLIQHFHRQVPILGVCLGHQALGEFFGARLIKSLVPQHGKTSKLFHNNTSIFKGIPQEFNVTRYHSLILTQWQTTNLVPLAFTKQKELMAFQHIHYPCIGLQFHPEAILTEFGFQILQNWAEYLFVHKNI